MSSGKTDGWLQFPGVKEGRYHPHPYLGEGFEGWGAADTDICEPWVYDVPGGSEGSDTVTG